MIKTQTGRDAISKKQALLIVLGIVLGVLMGALDNLIVSTALPVIVMNFNQPSVIPFLITTLKPLRSRGMGRFDVLGTAVLVAWVSLLLFPLEEVSNGYWSLGQPLPDGLIMTSLFITALFVFVEYRVAREPIVPFRMFKHRSVVSSSAISFFRGAVLFTLSTFISLFVIEVYAGLSNFLRDVLYGFVVPMVVGSIIGGVLLQRLSYRAICVLGTVLMAIGFIPLLNVSPSSPPWSFIWLVPVGGLIFGLIPIGFGVGITMAATTLSAQYSAEPQDIGASSSIVQFMGYMGGGIVLALVTVLVNNLYKSHIGLGSSPALSISLAIGSSFVVLLIASLITVISSVFMTGRLPIS